MSKYLDQLQFDPKKFGPFLSRYVTNMRVVALLLMALILGGTVSYFTLSRTLNPEIDITIVAVATALPGAAPEDVEELLTIPLEDEIETVDDIDIMLSTSRESTSVIVLQFLSGVDRARALSDVQSAVDSVSDLPADATEPSVDAIDFEDTPVVRYAITSSTDAASLNRFARSFADTLESDPLVDRVEVSGDETQEVQILVSQEKLAALGVDMQSLARAIAAVTQSYPAGTVDTEVSSFGLTIDRAVLSVDDLRKTAVTMNGTRYTLGDIATVSERSAPGARAAFLTAPDGMTQKAVTLNVHRVLDSKITDAAAAIDGVRGAVFAPDVAERFTLSEIMNVSRDMEKEFSKLFRNLSITVTLVFIVLLLFVGVRQAFVAALSIPLIFMAAFVVMRVTDISLNFLSVFSLLLSLGLLVDVTIVIVSAMTSYFRTGKFTPRETGLLVWKDFFMTLSVTTLTTVWAFVPLLLAGGIIGEFIRSIPIIVSSILIASVAIGFLIILPLMVWLLDFAVARRVRIFFGLVFCIIIIFVARGILGTLGVSVPEFFWILLAPLTLLLLFALLMVVKKGLHGAAVVIHKKFRGAEKLSTQCLHHGVINTRRFEDFYRRLLRAILHSRVARIKTVVIVVIFFVFSFSLVPLGFVKNEFFPGDDFDFVFVTIELPVGTKERVSATKARDFVGQLTVVPDVKRIQTQIGVELDENGEPSGGAGSHAILYTLQLEDAKKRTHSSKEIAQIVRDNDAVKNYHDGTLHVVEISGGPPAGAEVTVKLIGEDLTALNRFADETVAYLAAQPGVINPKKSVTSGTAKIVFTPDAQVLAQYGLTAADVGLVMRSFASGFTIEEDLTFSDTSDERDIVLRSSDAVQSADALERISVPLSSGARVPLSTLGSLRLAPNPTVIAHEDAERVISVTAGVEEGFNAGDINAAVGEFAEGELALPTGYRWETGGANEENNKSVASILQAMVLAFILIFLTLIIRLNSYRKSAIVLLVIPLAVSGVFVVFAIVGLPLSFPALIGVLALFGIVINNSIIIVDQINRNLREKIAFDDAVLDGAVSRFEPILLSSMTTIIGLTPITLSEPIWQGLGGAIIAGLIFSGAIMLFFIPTVFYMMFHKEATGE